MTIVNILAILILIFSFIGGIKEGFVKSLFALVTFFIALPLAGIAYHLLASLLSFLPGENWQNFLGFFITFGIITALLTLVFLLPRKILEKIFMIFFPLRIVGGFISVFSAALGMAVFALVLNVFPVWDWLANAVTGSGVVNWLVDHFGFIRFLMPEIFRNVPLKG